jgi:hypothetical protein
MRLLDQLVDFGWVVPADNDRELDVRHPSRLLRSTADADVLPLMQVSTPSES